MNTLNQTITSLIILFVILMLSSCGEVKVVKQNSPLSSVNPLGELVRVTVDKSADVPMDCLQLSEPNFGTKLVVSELDRDVFSRAVKAHIAPFEIPVTSDCRYVFQLYVNEFETQEFLIASRLVIALSASILDSADSQLVWAAEYRLTQNAGALPLDPISLGIGAVSAAKNTSKNSRSDSVYLAVRRLLMGLKSKPVKALNTIKRQNTQQPTRSTFLDALLLWQDGEVGEAIELAGELYTQQSRSSIGYEYGLMLESSGNEQLAAEVYADTAISQVNDGQLDHALTSLRRLEKLNDESQGQYNNLLDRALTDALDR
ncbi:MAG: hypothetical protein VXX88_06285 [Pseudomonadota bacterium]|nr:hypothetical protein [Pseudomonadota bacterium]